MHCPYQSTHSLLSSKSFRDYRVTFRTKLWKVNKITHFSDQAMKISENQYAQTLLMSQFRSNFLVDSLLVATSVTEYYLMHQVGEVLYFLAKKASIVVEALIRANCTG